MMDANFSLKRLSRKKELVSYQVAEETRVWVTQSEVESAASAEKKAKEDAKKKGKGREIKVSSPLQSSYLIFSKYSSIF